MFIKRSGLFLLFIICLGLLWGCSGIQTTTGGIKIKTSDYKAEELVEKINKDIKFGMSKEEIIKLKGKTINGNIVHSEMNYLIKINSKKALVSYYINENDCLYGIGIALTQQTNAYNDYVNDYKAIHRSLVDLYGKPTDIDNIISDTDTEDYGYEVLLGNTKYSSVWDLEDLKITAKLRNLGEIENVILLSLYIESKEF